MKKEQLVGAVVGIGAVAAGYYLYKKNQNKVDNFLRKQGINVKTSNTANYESMDLESLMTVKEHIEDLIVCGECFKIVKYLLFLKKGGQKTFNLKFYILKNARLL